MSQFPEDRDSTSTQRDAPSRTTVGGTSGPTVGGEPAMPGTREFEREVEQNPKTPLGLSTALLWTVGILLIAAIVLIIYFAM